MSLVDDFAVADLVYVSLSAKYWDERGQIASSGNPKNLFATPQLVPKPSGLSFTLTSEEFNLPFPVALHVTGMPAGTNDEGNPLVRFRIGQDVGLHVEEQDVIIDRVDGELGLELLPVTDPAVEHGGGECNVPTVRFRRAPQIDSWIDVKARARVLGTYHDDTLYVRNVLLGGVGSKVVNSRVEIRVQRDACGVGLVQGTVARLTASISGAPLGLQPQYAWTVTGTDPVGATNGASLQIQVPDDSREFSVSLKVTFGTCILGDRVDLRGVDPQLSQMLGEMCVLHTNYTKLNLLVDPLGPDVRRDLSRVREVASRIVALTETLMTRDVRRRVLPRITNRFDPER